ncbi:DUF3043 domain-containing protein [Blastococcus sp. Marseille-P5729]|uniref:DUF3043 domain-containing protein n=1 Tax=Blastococcus sp. Marseille-P5729 TaxID=2086582 RepID=UPI000D0EC08D|nr:DUF3043 domain-containing protein [Blastococcus sp. Marseille-P5729]
MKMPWSKSAPAPAEPPAVPAAPADEVEVHRDPTAPKGRPTPKRREAEGRARGPVAPPPTTGKEARARAREKARERKAAGLPPERQERAMSAREERITARDAGPERALVRDIVDSRRSISSFFPLFAVVILVAMFAGLPTKNPQMYNYLTLTWLAFFVVIIVESYFLSRVIGTAVRQRFPKTDQRMGSLKYYGVIRGLMMRRLRYPKPVVEIGEAY